jgi:hypothetical protein
MTFPRLLLRPLILGLCALGAAGAVLLVSYIRFTSTDSRYCWTCHDDIWDLWQKSGTHPPEPASCTDCHEDPARAARTGVVAKSARNLNANCLECHADQPEVTTVKRELIKLSHKVHVTDEGCRCTDCHRTVAHDRNPAPTNRPTKWSCYVCKVHEKEIDGEVNEKNCMRCHFIIMDRPAEDAKKKE